MAVRDEPAQGLADGVERAVARPVAEHRSGSVDARRDAPLGVLPGRRGVLGAHPSLELRPLDEIEDRLAAEPAGDAGGKSAQRHGLLGDDVEARPDRGGASERALEGLGDVVGVHVVQDAQPEVRQRERFAGGQAPPHVEIQIARRGDRRPRAADVPGMEDHARHAAGDRLAVQQRLDRCLAGAVLAIGGARLVLGDRHAGDPPVHPDAAAVHQQRPDRPQRVHQLLRGRGREAEHVDDGVGNQRRDPLAEVLGPAVDGEPLDPAPLRCRRVGLARAPADRHDLVPGPDQPRDEVGPHVPGGADDDDAAHARCSRT